MGQKKKIRTLVTCHIKSLGGIKVITGITNCHSPFALLSITMQNIWNVLFPHHNPDLMKFFLHLFKVKAYHSHSPLHCKSSSHHVCGGN